MAYLYKMMELSFQEPDPMLASDQAEEMEKYRFGYSFPFATSLNT
jgi:hypothetical protein